MRPMNMFDAVAALAAAEETRDPRQPIPHPSSPTKAVSEYQYYEFQAVDRPLDEAALSALRRLSSRARITQRSFTNSYDWGDFRGDPVKLMESWFDLHLYLANWGSRRLMVRLPARLVDGAWIERVLSAVECAELTTSGEHLILDIQRDEEGWQDRGEDDPGPGELDRLAPLRADVLSGDCRLVYLVWLMGVEDESLPDEGPEPLTGPGPLSPAHEAFVAFFGIDPDLVKAAAERGCGVDEGDVPRDAARSVIAAMSEAEKTDLLMRVLDGEPHVGFELRAAVWRRLAWGRGAAADALRTAGELRARTAIIRAERERARAERAAAQREARARQEQIGRRKRMDALILRGESAWNEVEAEIERRNPAGYEGAMALLRDLKAIADDGGQIEDFLDRLQAIRERHARKGRFIARLEEIG